MPEFIKQLYWTICYYSFLLMFITGTILLNLLSLVLLPVLPKGKARSILRKTSYHLFDLYFRTMEASSTLITNRDLLARIDAAKGGLLIVANHPSMLDAPIFFSRVRGLICVFKSSLSKSLGIGRTADAIGYLSNDGGLDMIRNLSNALKDGEKVLLFPEGTRTASDTVDPFNPVYALAAIRAQVPVQLARVHSNTPILSKKQSLFSPTRFPCRFHLELGPTIEPGEFKTVRTFNDFVGSWYKSIPKPVETIPVKFLPVSRECIIISDTCTCVFRIPADPFYCRGHMPGNPIVPAYAQLAWVGEIMREWDATILEPVEYFRWKFLHPILPGDRISIQINRSAGNSNVVISREDLPVTKGLLRFPGKKT